ncbi:Nif11-like leader peptide family natural product precursor [Calothrix sp. 336/3]|uniref:Nif11-like leader peptide family natural product precursor n=1 Tax=Calothrix sp. 336/3 TaxID=1337936 RepID=UPI0004E3E8C9|nr:Nif11-like leader peptide family natural product precursor [Calothrix sp. 336/3]AKG21154.1 hypothetical protein IJ00_07440 [Calothrix sp. 336/3]
MSLEQVNAFYAVLNSDTSIYQKYYDKCCYRGFFGSCHWDKAKVISFAASLGYDFTERELDAAWFGDDVSNLDEPINTSIYRQISAY